MQNKYRWISFCVNIPHFLPACRSDMAGGAGETVLAGVCAGVCDPHSEGRLPPGRG